MYKLTVSNLEPLLAKLTPDLYRPAVEELMVRCAVLGERTARANAPFDWGNLARSIVSEAKPMEARVWSMLTPGAVYPWVMEYGRTPGGRMPPLEPIRIWMRRHGMDPKFAFVLARAIARRGIKGRFFMQAAATAVRNELPVLTREALDTIAKQWGS